MTPRGPSLAAVGLAVGLAACGPKPRPNAVSSGDAVVYLRSNLSDALVYVDGRFVGPISVIRGGVALDPGKHRIELRHEDYFSRYVELEVARAEKQQLQLDLAPVLP